MPLSKYSIGKIAERIVMNELESRGYRATDLNKDGLSANSDVLAAKDGKTWQIQVKGATNKPNDRWWIQYGHCDAKTINRETPVFNRRDSFYTAQYVALIAIKSPSKYRCFILPVEMAEKAAQTNLDRYYRKPRVRDGGVRKPGKIWVTVEESERDRRRDPLLDEERKILREAEDAWSLA
jgi:hypothetical protein